ncbi:ASST-domain-containing protein, partial [Mycena galopus ATCC 62051]
LFLTCPVGTDVAQPGPTIYDSHGELVWADPTLGACTDLNLQTYDGSDHLTMWIGTGAAGTGLQTGSGMGIMLNSKYEIVHNVSAVNPEGTDLHEFNIARPENKTALVTAYNPIPLDLTSVGGPEDGWYLNAIIQEIDIATGAVLFNWTSVDHIALSESYNNLTQTGEGNASAPWDAVHINSIDKDAAGNYLISARHSQAVYKIDKNGTIIWRLGGKIPDFTDIGNNTEFHWQHHARWRADETQVSLFDDGAAVIDTTIIINEPVASGKFLALDEQAMTVSLAAQFLPSPLSSFSLAEGSTEPYGSTVVTGYGINPWVVVQDYATGAVLLSAIIGPNTTLPAGAITNYRAFQMSTLQFTGNPTQPPGVALVGGDVYVSWNGATHVAAWALITGASADAVTETVTTVRKAGFETQISAAGVDNFIAVVALAANGTTLGRS